MSAAPQTSTAVPQPALPAPSGVEFIDLRTAGERAGLDWKGLRHRLKDWLPRGLAKMQPPPGGGKPIWYVREDADPRFGRGAQTIEQLNREFDMRPFTEDQRNVILQREKVVVDWEALLGRTPRGEWEQATQHYLDVLLTEGVEVTRKTLYNWRERYHQQGGRAGLVDARWKQSKVSGGPQDRGSDRPFDNFYRELESWYRDGNEPSMTTCYRQARAVARRNGWPFPSSRSARRYLSRLRKPSIDRARKGDKYFDDKHAAYVARDYTKIVIDGVEREMFSNDIWCADHHICDTLVRDGQHADGRPRYIRPWLTAWQDVRSRKIVGYRFWKIAPDSSAVLLALRSAVMNSGMCLPRYAYTDNGKDFDCWMLTGQSKWERKHGRIDHDLPRFDGVFGLLQIGVWHATPYNAKAKPVERFFRTFEDQFGRMTRTYCGGRPDRKPHHLDERLKRGEAPTFDDYVAQATAWIEEAYHQSEHLGHGMDGKSPDAVYAANLHEKRTTTAEALSCCLKLTPKPVKVGRNGIVCNKRVYGHGDPALIALDGQLVQPFLDPEDISKIEVRAADGTVVTLSCNELAPWGQVKNEKMRRAIARTRAHNKKLADVQKSPAGMRLVRDPLEFYIEDLRQEQRPPSSPAQPPPTPTLIPVRTGLEGVSTARAAVGSESIAFPTPTKSAPSLDQIRARIAPRQRDDNSSDLLAKLRERNHAW